MRKTCLLSYKKQNECKWTVLFNKCMKFLGKKDEENFNILQEILLPGKK